jgi:hypothetical protein
MVATNGGRLRIGAGMSPALGGALLLAIAAWPANAQPPDFSGNWTAVAPAGEAGTARGAAPPTLSALGDMGSGWGSPITLTQEAGALVVECAYFHPRDAQPPVRLRYALDGAESRNTVNMGRGPQLQVSRAEWRDAHLVITTIHEFENPEDGRPATSETRQTLSLQAPGTLVIETVRGGVLGGRSSTTRTTYRR